MFAVNRKGVVAHKSRIGKIFPILRFEHTAQLSTCPIHGEVLHAPAFGGCVECAQEAALSYERSLQQEAEEKQYLESCLDQAIRELSQQIGSQTI